MFVFQQRQPETIVKFVFNYNPSKKKKKKKKKKMSISASGERQGRPVWIEIEKC